MTAIHQTRLSFTVAMAGITFVVSAALPPLAYLLLSGAAISLALYREQWGTIADNHPPLNIDNTSLTLMGFGVLVMGIFFMPLNLLSQMVLSSLASAGISWIFVSECVQKSQIILDKRLIEATKFSNVNEVNRLLKLGADPFAPDVRGNCAFHHAIQNHVHAPVVLQALRGKAQKAHHDLHSVLSHTKKLFTDQDIRAMWRAWWLSLKTCYRQNNRQHRANFSRACTDVMQAYLPVLKYCLKKLTRYLRENAAYPRDINVKNRQGATVGDILNTVKLSSNVKQALQATLTDMKAKKGTKISTTAIAEVTVARMDNNTKEQPVAEKALSALRANPSMR